MQAAPTASSEMLTVLKAEHAADRVQALGACEGMEGSGIASAEAFKVLQDGQKEGSDSKVSTEDSLQPYEIRHKATSCLNKENSKMIRSKSNGNL